MMTKKWISWDDVALALPAVVQAKLDADTGASAASVYAAAGLAAAAMVDAQAASDSSTYALAQYVPLVLFIGESNSGGQSLNTALTAAEKLARPAVQILHNTSLTFQPLQIGVNNLIDHFGLGTALQHGWEAGLATSAEAGQWEGQVYLVKAGQGGSTLAQWNQGGTYMTKFLARYAAADAAIRALGKIPQPYIFMSMGINDHNAGTSVALFRSGMLDWFARIRAATGPAPLFMTRLPDPVRATYNAVLDDLPRFDPLAWVAPTEQSDMDDVAHWSSTGMKRIARQMIARSVRTIGQGRLYVDYVAFGQAVKDPAVAVWTAGPGTTATSDGTITNTGMGTGAGAIGQAIDATKAFQVEIIHKTEAFSNAAVVALAPTNAETYVYGAHTYLTGIYQLTGNIYSATAGTGGPDAILTASTVYPLHLRMRNAGTDVIYSKSTDSGLTWADIWTDAGVLAGQSTVYLKTYFASAGERTAKVIVL